MKSVFKATALLILLLVTWAVDVYTCSVYHVPGDPIDNSDPHTAEAQFIPKTSLGIHQLILKGTPYGRGYLAGQRTAMLLKLQEETLTSQLKGFFSNPLGRRIFEVLTTRWFLGSEKYFEPWMLEEMDGVSRWTSPEFDYLGNPLTRQIAYHGLHEVGQMMVDQGGEGMGCTVVLVPDRGKWMIGRNFDFEGGRIFDSEKLMKWVFPDRGHAFVSVIWAGMVGAVTGVNEKGVYISLNAAGTRDFRRMGTPSTLVITKALMESDTAEDAVAIIGNSTMFIADLFVVSDGFHTYRVEKSPLATEVLEEKEGNAITNHFISPRWAQDPINHMRTFELTSMSRLSRAEKLVHDVQGRKIKDSKEMVLSVLKILRDKGEDNGKPLQLGNRKAIDALIATHSVIYNERDNILYVSEGLGVSGPFSAFDLGKSFSEKRPVKVGELPSDPLVTNEKFKEVRFVQGKIADAQKFTKKNLCYEADAILNKIASGDYKPYEFYSARGDVDKCLGHLDGARASWLKALDLSPAYPREVTYLRKALQ